MFLLMIVRANFNSYGISEENSIRIETNQDLVIKLGAKLFGRVEL